MNKKITLVALLGLVNLAPAVFGQYIYLVEKEQGFIQTGAGTTTTDPSQTYRFEADIVNGTEDANTPASSSNITTPAGGNGLESLVFNASDGQWEFKQNFTDQPSFEAAFPNGSYTFNSGGTTASIGLTGNLYTNIPTATLSLGGTWNNGTYDILPGQNLTITTNSIAGFVSGDFRVAIDANDSEFNYSQQFDSLNGGLTASSGNITIPASELPAGDDWQIKMQFNAFASNTPSGLNGGETLGLYSMNTEFNVDVIPEPAETTLLAGLVMLSAVMLWRRRRSQAAPAS